MCGLFGILSNDPKMRAAVWPGKVVSDLGIVSSLRGRDSTGLMVLPEQKGLEPYVYKAPLEASMFFQLDKVKTILDNFTSYYGVIGHARWATRGAVNINNSHPFQCGPISMVHNGTIINPAKLVGKAVNPFDTDSEAICAALAMAGPEEYQSVLEQIDGPFVIVWHDSRTGITRAARNEANAGGIIREFHYAPMKDFAGVVLASEFKAVELMEERYNLTLDEVYVLPAGQIMTFGTTDPRKIALSKFTMYTPPKPVPVPRTKGGNVQNIRRSLEFRTVFTNEALFKELGIPAIGTTIEFGVSTYTTPKSKSRHGIARGLACTAPYFRVISYGAAERMIGQEVLEGRVIGVMLPYAADGISALKSDPIVVVDQLSIIKRTSGLPAPLRIVEARELQVIPAASMQYPQEAVSFSAPANAPLVDAVTQMDDVPMVSGPGGYDIPFEQWERLTKHGCSLCNCDLSPQDTVVWEGSEPLCESCGERFAATSPYMN